MSGVLNSHAVTLSLPSVVAQDLGHAGVGLPQEIGWTNARRMPAGERRTGKPQR